MAVAHTGHTLHRPRRLNRSGPTGGCAAGIERHRFTPSRVKPSTVPELIVARTTCSCINRPYRTNSRAARLAGPGYRPASLADMRIAVLIAASVLVGAVHRGWPRRRADGALPVGPNQDQRQRRARPRPHPSTPAKAPEAGAEVGDVIKFIESGRPADVNQFHSATRDGRRNNWAMTSPSPHRRASRSA